MKLDKAEDTIDEKLKSELHYLQNAYKRANPDHEDDEGARRVEHTLLREETQALLKELQPSPKEEPSDGEGDEEMDEDTEEVVQMKQAAALVEKMRSRRKQMMRSITAPAQLPSEKALDKPSRSLEAPKMPRLTSDSVLTKPSRGGMLRIVADPVCIGNSKAALRAKKLERHRALAKRNAKRHAKIREAAINSKNRRKQLHVKLLQKAKTERADEIARDLGYKDAAEQLKMANEEANAKMADDEKRTRDDLEDRLREEKALAEQQAAHEDEEDDADFTDPLFDFDIEDVYNGSEEGRGKEMDVGPNAEGANAEVANVKDTNTEVPNAKGEFEPQTNLWQEKQNQFM